MVQPCSDVCECVRICCFFYVICVAKSGQCELCVRFRWLVNYSTLRQLQPTNGSPPLNIMSELKDCSPLKYYDFKPVDHVRLCPRYTAVLGRSEDDGIGSGELDTLQLELETLLSSASRRLRALEEQRQVSGQSFIQQQIIGTQHLLHCFHPSRSSQIGKTKKETSASSKWEKTQILLPHPATSPRSKNWMGRELMDKDRVLEDPNPKTCSRRFRSMNLQMTHKISHAPPKMMLPTGQHKLLWQHFFASALLFSLFV